MEARGGWPFLSRSPTEEEDTELISATRGGGGDHRRAHRLLLLPSLVTLDKYEAHLLDL